MSCNCTDTAPRFRVENFANETTFENPREAAIAFAAGVGTGVTLTFIALAIWENL